MDAKDQAREQFETAVKDLHAARTRMDEEMKAIGQVSSETKAAAEKASAAVTAFELKFDELAKKADRIEAVETALAEIKGMPGNGRPQADKEKASIRERFLKWVKDGVWGEKSQHPTLALGPIEQKALVSADDTTGGYLRREDMIAEIIKGVVEQNPIRPFCRIKPTTGATVRVPKRTTPAEAQWAGEVDVRTATQAMEYGLEDMPLHEQFALVDISNQDLEDAAFDLEAELRMEFEEQFALSESRAFISGNGIKKPEGILTHTGVVGHDGTLKSGAASAITADGLIRLTGAIKTAYARNARLLLNRSTLTAVRLLKDDAGGAGVGNYIWQPGLTAGQPNMLAGAPYTECPDMPEVAAGSFPVAFGDLRYYVIGDRLVLSILRDPFTQATSGAVRFVARKRVGGQLTLGEAFAKLKIAA